MQAHQSTITSRVRNMNKGHNGYLQPSHKRTQCGRALYVAGSRTAKRCHSRRWACCNLRQLMAYSTRPHSSYACGTTYPGTIPGPLSFCLCFPHFTMLIGIGAIKCWFEFKRIERKKCFASNKESKEGVAKFWAWMCIDMPGSGLRVVLKAFIGVSTRFVELQRARKYAFSTDAD